jgi:hypothetical protein
MFRTVGLFGALLLLPSVQVSARVLPVPSEYGTIQEGLDAASPGDTVLVAPGTYTGPGNRNLDFRGKDLVLVSEAGAEATVIDVQGNAPRRGFQFHSRETRAAVVDGFTIRGGWGDIPGESGAGILIESSSPTIRNCIIKENAIEELSGGAGIYSDGNSAPLIYRCVITANYTVGHYGTFGIGIACGGSTEVRECVVSRNLGSQDTWGAGVGC